MAQPTMRFTVMDYGRETSVVGFNLRAHTGTPPADWDGLFGDIATADRYELRTALNGVTRGVITNETGTAVINKVTNVGPTDPNAQREQKLLVVYEDDVTKSLYSVEIPALDYDAVTLKENSDEVVLADGGVMAALVTAMETHAVSKDGNAINVIRAVAVGRNI